MRGSCGCVRQKQWKQIRAMENYRHKRTKKRSLRVTKDHARKSTVDIQFGQTPGWVKKEGEREREREYTRILSNTEASIFRRKREEGARQNRPVTARRQRYCLKTADYGARYIGDHRRNRHTLPFIDVQWASGKKLDWRSIELENNLETRGRKRKFAGGQLELRERKRERESGRGLLADNYAQFAQ